MATTEIVLAKGESLTFLDYTIKNSLNNDGLVLMKTADYKLYETHLGNYGEGTQKNIDSCKKYALIHFMLARPETFASSLASKIAGGNGTYHEWYLLKDALKKERIEMPKEITAGDGMNCMIYINGKPLRENL